MIVRHKKMKWLHLSGVVLTVVIVATGLTGAQTKNEVTGTAKDDLNTQEVIEIMHGYSNS
ncbi:MAG: hypothetical protein LBQ54_05070 [Planctomycetaceae bacterium]|jgi:hypothetical protein|nr:hypothetical protein [Planctomycetaceae bacterium]